jgi:hypothetical protein
MCLSPSPRRGFLQSLPVPLSQARFSTVQVRHVLPTNAG